jgi:hypothetical protein
VTAPVAEAPTSPLESIIEPIITPIVAPVIEPVIDFFRQVKSTIVAPFATSASQPKNPAIELDAFEGAPNLDADLKSKGAQQIAPFKIANLETSTTDTLVNIGDLAAPAILVISSGGLALAASMLIKNKPWRRIRRLATS